MEKMLNQLNDEILFFEEKLKKVVENQQKVGYRTWLRTNATDAVKCEFLIEHLQGVMLALKGDKYSVDEVYLYLDDLIKRYEHLRLESNPIHYNTNPIENLVSLWEFECYAQLIKIYKRLQRILPK